MSIQLGDFAEDATLDFKWSTNSAAGASITRATNGTVSVYVGNSATQLTTGVTDTEDFDSLTGVHHCRIDLSASATYAPGSECQVVLSAATIDGASVNAVLAHFSIERAGGVLALLKGVNGLATIKADIIDLPAAVKDQVVDALTIDTYPEPGQGAPAATASLATKLGFLYKAWRNRHTQTASEYALYADNGTTKDQDAVVSDNGTTFERGKLGTGA